MEAQAVQQEKKAGLSATVAFKSLADHWLSFFANRMYSSTNVIGIDVGSAYVKILQLEKGGRRYSVRNVGTRAIPQQARENSAE